MALDASHRRQISLKHMIAIPRIAHCEYIKVCVFFSNTLKEISDHFIYRFNLIVDFNIHFQKKHIVVQQNIVWKEITSSNSTFGIHREAHGPVSQSSQGIQRYLHCHIEKGFDRPLTQRPYGFHAVFRS